ncbi:MAG: SRPBCC family protein [Planctomycetota bacterium]|nr:SRPBCC family protein [Planctomycetota bacterium]
MDRSPAPKPKFVYVTYITSTPEKLWQALISPEFTTKYWSGYRWESDWKAGSDVAARRADGKVTISGKVLVSEHPRRLSFTWNPLHEGMPSERPSRVTYELEAVEEQVKLSVVHDDFEPGSAVFELISTGWPKVLSSLKSLLETGKPLGITSKASSDCEMQAKIAAAKAEAARKAAVV